MTNKEFRDNIIDLFFGEDYTIVDSINDEQVNDVIMEKLEKEYNYLREDRKLDKDIETFKQTGLNIIKDLKRRWR